MAFQRLPLPALTTTSLPPSVHNHSSSSSSGSPLTPFSELSAISSSGTSIGLKTPTFVSDGPTPSKNYITYPDRSFPPRQLTPPPKSRFAPLFESFSKGSASPPDLSRRGSLGDDEASPVVAPITLPFSVAVTEKMMNPRLTPAHFYVEPALKRAFLAGSNTGFGQWAPRSEASHAEGDSKDSAVEKLESVVRTLRHQMNLKNHRIQLAETEITRLSSTCTSLVDQKAKLADDYFRAKSRIEELEGLLYNNEPPIIPSQCPLPPHARFVSEFRPRWDSFHSKHTSNPDQKIPLWQEEVKKQGCLTPHGDTDADKSAIEDALGETTAPAEPASDETYHTVLTRIPEMPSEVILGSVDKLFLSPRFDFIHWLENNGLELPESMKKLAGLSWEDRLRLDEGDLERLGVNDTKDRSYIMRVLKVIAEGEYPHLHESLLSEPFTEEQYIAIMREQRIDKHVPNLSGIPWPLRLFVDEVDLALIQVQKAGARGTIMTVFGGLRKGGVRPEPRPRRGTKKSKRVKMEAAAAASGDVHTEGSSRPEKSSRPPIPVRPKSSGPSGVKKGSNIKITMGHQGPRMTGAARGKAAFTPAHSHSLSSNNPSWYGHRV